MVSVVIPCFNAENWILKCIGSCLDQGEYLYEIVIINDFSTDKTLELIDSFKRQNCNASIHIYNNNSKGGNNARNLGFSKSSGKFIQWLDSDDILLPGKFKHQLKAFEEKPDIDIVYSDWQLDTYDAEEKVKATEKKFHESYEDFLYELLTNNWSPPHNYLLKRSFAEKLFEQNAWNPETQVFQDREYFTMAALLDAKFHHVPGVYSIYNRWSKSSVSQADSNKRYQNLYEICERFLTTLESVEPISSEKKKTYIKLLKTEMLICSTFNKKIKLLTNISFSDIHWNKISGFRTRIKAFIAFYLYKLSLN